MKSWLRESRKLAGLTLDGLSVSTMIDPAILSRVENGYIKLSPEQEKRIRQVLAREMKRRAERIAQLTSEDRFSRIAVQQAG